MTAQLTRLENGFTALTVPGTGSMTAMLFVAAGARYEAREVAGTAHFLEHLFFKGTPTRPSTLQIAAEIDSMGCVFNAFTSNEYTAYFIKGAEDYAERAVAVLSDLLRNALIPTEEVERERGVVLQEMKMYHDQPAARCGRMIHGLLYGDTPLGWDVLGFPEIITSVTREQVLAYREAFYAPDRMTLVIAGNVEHATTVRLARENFATMVPRPAAAAPPAIFGSERVAQDHRDVQQATLQLAFPGPSYASGERELAASRLATIVLGGSMSSRLFIQVRERQGLCYHISASNHAYSDAGGLHVSTGVEPDRAVRAVTSILSEMEKIAVDGLSVDEAEKARALYKGRYVIGREDSMQEALGACTDILFRGHVMEREELFALLDSISRDEMVAAASRYHRPGELRLALVGPPDVEAGSLAMEAAAAT
ncbi:MAG: M16 family metallopeptidase [Candidatus Dormibacteria bacterium]